VKNPKQSHKIFDNLGTSEVLQALHFIGATDYQEKDFNGRNKKTKKQVMANVIQAYVSENCGCIF